MGDLISSNLTLAVHNRHFNLFNKSLDDYTYNILKDRIEVVNDNKITSIIEERQLEYAVLLRKADILSISRNLTNIKHGRPIFRVLSDCPLPIVIVYGLRFGSPYLNKVNDILHHLNQGGILEHWAKSDEFKVDENLSNPDNKEKKPLNLGNLQELFVVWSFGLILSTIVFLFEIILHGKRQQIKEYLKRKNEDTLQT